MRRIGKATPCALARGAGCASRRWEAIQPGRDALVVDDPGLAGCPVPCSSRLMPRPIIGEPSFRSLTRAPIDHLDGASGAGSTRVGALSGSRPVDPVSWCWRKACHPASPSEALKSSVYTAPSGLRSLFMTLTASTCIRASSPTSCSATDLPRASTSGRLALLRTRARVR